MADRQRATALYFIDRLALRAGNEKGEDEADTVGCCSLRYEHVTLEPPNKVIFDFLGKDSMRFHQEVEVDSQVFKNIKIFKGEPKKKGDDLFDRLNVRRILTAFLCVCVADESLISDWASQQIPQRLDERSQREGVPYLQRVVDVPATVEKYAQEWHHPGEDRRVQHRQPGCRDTVQPSKDRQQDVCRIVCQDGR